jgi:hypothetical protein
MAIDFIGDGLPVVSKGDIASSDGTASVSIQVGTSSQILTARSSTSSGLAWETAGSPAVPKFEAISYTYVSANVKTVTLSSIPQTYDDLLIIMMAKNTSTVSGNTDYVKIKSSNITTSSYALNRFTWYSANNGNSPDINEYPSLVITGTSAEFGYGVNNVGSISANWFVGTARILNYSSTSLYKPFYSRMGTAGYGASSTNPYTNANFGEIRSNTAISSLDIFESTYGFRNGTWIALYGVKNS